MSAVSSSSDDEATPRTEYLGSRPCTARASPMASGKASRGDETPSSVLPKWCLDRGRAGQGGQMRPSAGRALQALASHSA